MFDNASGVRQGVWGSTRGLGFDEGSGVRSEGLRGRNEGLGFEKGSGDKKAVLVARVNKKAGRN